MLCQPTDRYQKAIDVTVQTLVMEAVDQMMAIREQKQVNTDEAVEDKTEQQYSPDTVLTPTCTPPNTVLTPTCTPPAPVRTSTPADVPTVCVPFILCHLTKPLGMQASIFGACPKPG